MRKTLLRLGILATLFAGAAQTARAAGEVKIDPDVVYGHKDGMALTFDVIRPARPGGAAVLWIQSGGWYSNWVEARVWPAICKPFLDKGVTVFIVRHGSAPRFTVPDAVEDVRRSVRFIRLKAKTFGVDPERLGVTGGSAGGHLSLMLGTTGDDGAPGSKDEVLRQSSRVAAVVALYPPTDISTWVTNPPEVIRKIPALKPPLTFDAKKAPDLSPLLKVTGKSAPTLLIHGDKDELVPIDHSTKMVAALGKAKVPCKLVTVKGAGHGFSAKQNQELILPAMLDWFEKHLAAKVSHSFLATGGETFLVDGAGKVLWSYADASRDGWVLPGGNLLLALGKSKDHPGGAAVEVTRAGKVVFEYKGTQSEVNTVQPLDDGNVLLTEAGAKPRLLEADRKGKVVVVVPLAAQTRDHHLQTRMARKLANGNYLVPQLLDRVVREYTPAGKVVWEVKTPHWPFTAVRLDGGNTLIGCTLGNTVVEVDRNGETVWKLTNDDLPGKPINDACGVQRLPNGNTVVTSHHAGPGEVKLFEVTRDKELVWTYTDARKSGIHHFQILDGDGKPLRGRPLR